MTLVEQDDPTREVAAERLATLRESDERVWAIAVRQNTATAYAEYMKTSPSGYHYQEARSRILAEWAKKNARREALETSERWSRLRASIQNLSDARLPRSDVQVLVFDNGEHGSHVKRILQSIYRGSVDQVELQDVISMLQVVANLKQAKADTDVVVNMSWVRRDPQSSPLEEAAFRTLSNAGVVFIAAAGNDGSWTTNYPAGYSSVLSVGAVDQDGSLTEYSSRGKLNFCAVDRTSSEIRRFVESLEGALSSSYCQAALRGEGPDLEARFRRFLDSKERELTANAGTSFTAPVIAGALAKALKEAPSVPIVKVIENLKLQASQTEPPRRRDLPFKEESAYRCPVVSVSESAVDYSSFWTFDPCNGFLRSIR